MNQTQSDEAAIMETLFPGVLHRPSAVTGSLSVLNVGEGDIHMTFNNEDPAEAEKAITMLVDMQKRGYAILVRLPDNTYVRAQSIDASTGSYIVQIPADVVETSAGSESEATPEAGNADEAKKRPGRPRKSARQSMPIASTRAVGVARSAGG